MKLKEYLITYTPNTLWLMVMLSGKAWNKNIWITLVNIVILPVAIMTYNKILEKKFSLEDKKVK